MLQRLLIANRGEIACRIIQTAKRLGIHTIAIYSDADALSRHVRMADEAHYIGPSPALESYLNIDKIIQISIQSRAQAIHPGYGFLSENPLFAQACINNQLIFIGPSVQALNIMGSKQQAKAALINTKVPLTPGYHGIQQSIEYLTKEAKKLGFPLLIKAAAGGGGKGMRVVRSLDTLENDLKAAQRESMAYFGDSTLILETYLTNARHVEVQILGDHHGQVVSLFDRDCSIQRRHQKIIEEAPAPNLKETTRNKLHQAAREVAATIQYVGAGTIEFLLDTQENFYFMEMNTRLQVEHPVTEAITGLDLVEWQLRIAQNEALPTFIQNLNPTGHAIECRIYAEDPAHDFLPSVGEFILLNEPSGIGVRIDKGYDSHDQLSAYYDPLISKLITHGGTRQEAVQKMEQALQQYAIAGLNTNISFLQTIIKNDNFRSAHLSTNFLTEEQLIDINSSKFDIAKLLCIAWHYGKLNALDSHNPHNSHDPLKDNTFGYHPFSKQIINFNFKYQNQIIPVRLNIYDTHNFELLSDNNSGIMNIKIHGNQLWIQNTTQRIHGWVFEQQEYTYCIYQGICFKFEIFQEKTQATLNTDAHSAPMPGKVVAVLKQNGDQINIDDSVLIIEAMKMEHTIRAAESGILKNMFYKNGDIVKEGSLLFEVSAIEANS